MFAEVFGRRLAALRTVKEFTQMEMAGRLNITVQHYGRLERGESAPSFKMIERLAQVLDLQPAELFTFDEGESAVDGGRHDSLVATAAAAHPLGAMLVDAATQQACCSASFGTLFGYGEEEGCDPWLILEKHLRAEDVARLHDCCSRALQGGDVCDTIVRLASQTKRQRPAVVHVERIYDAAGTLQAVQLLFQRCGLPYADGGAETTIGAGDRDRGEAARDTERQDAVTPAEPCEGAWEWDLRNHTTYFSPEVARMLGYEDDDAALAGADFQTWKERVAPADVHRLTKIFTDVFGGVRLQQFAVELRLRRKDGRFGLFACQGVCVRDADGAVKRISGTLSPLGSPEEEELTAEARGECLKFLLPGLFKASDTVTI